MRPLHHAAPVWRDQQEFRSSAAWKLLSSAPWALAFLRAEFTSARPRIGLEAFHASLDAFLKHVRAQDAAMNESLTASGYADAWVRSRFLARPLVDGHFVYEPTAQTARVLTFLEDFTGARTNLNSSRLNTLLTSLEDLAHETDPDPQARIKALEAEIRIREERIATLEAGTSPAVLPRDGAVAAARSVLQLASTLPADFKRMRDGVQEMLHVLRTEIMESSTAKGVAIGQVLEGDRALRGTPEGATFRGFTEFLNEPARQARFRQAVNEVLERDFIDELDAQERHTLANLVRELRRQASEVHHSYGRLSESLHAYVQTEEFRESQLLRSAVRSAELAVASSPALRPRTSAAPIRLYNPRFTTLATLGIYDPAEHIAPPKLADPPALNVSDIHRTPSTPKADPAALAGAVQRARTQGSGTASLGDAFGQLDPGQQHLNSIRYLIQVARAEAGGMDETRFERVVFIQVDGSERTAYLPVITFTKDLA